MGARRNTSNLICVWTRASAEKIPGGGGGQRKKTEK